MTKPHHVAGHIHEKNQLVNIRNVTDVCCQHQMDYTQYSVGKMQSFLLLLWVVCIVTSGLLNS
jgi:hypothetical protein